MVSLGYWFLDELVSPSKNFRVITLVEHVQNGVIVDIAQSKALYTTIF